MRDQMRLEVGGPAAARRHRGEDEVEEERRAEAAEEELEAIHECDCECDCERRGAMRVNYRRGEARVCPTSRSHRARLHTARVADECRLGICTAGEWKTSWSSGSRRCRRQPPPPAFAASDLATHPFFLTLACMLVLDVAVCRHTSARWFLLHAWGNIIVTVFALPDALLAADNPGTSCIGGASTYVPLWQIIALHLYHLVFFACSTADWVHHCVFVSIIGRLRAVLRGRALRLAPSVSRRRRPARVLTHGGRPSTCGRRRPRLRDALAREARPSRSAR